MMINNYRYDTAVVVILRLGGSRNVPPWTVPRQKRSPRTEYRSYTRSPPAADGPPGSIFILTDKSPAVPSISCLFAQRRYCLYNNCDELEQRKTTIRPTSSGQDGRQRGSGGAANVHRMKIISVV